MYGRTALSRKLLKGDVMEDNKMSTEKMEKMTAKLKEVGIDEKLIDEKLLWTVKKASFKLMKLRLVLDEKGVSEDESKAIVEKLVAKTIGRDLAKAKEWQQEHENKEHMHHKEHCHHYEEK